MKTVDFNALPRAVRERLIGCMARKRKPKPILVQPSITGLQIFLWVMLGVGSFIGVMISPEFLLGDSDASVGAAVGAAVLLALSLGCGLLAVLGLLRSVTQALALPFEGGLYLFPMDLIDARERVLQLIPMHTLVVRRVVHHRVNWAYSHSDVTFTFANGVSHAFTVRGKKRVEQVLAFVDAAAEHPPRLAHVGDDKALRALDPLFDVRVVEGGLERKAPAKVDGPSARAVSPIFHPAAMFRLSAAVGVGVALLLFLARGTLVDEIMFRRAMRLSSEPGFLTYLARGKRHADEVKTVLLPRAALEAARQGGTVTALQAFRRRFPGSAVDDEARKSLHELYDRALGELRARYSTADPHLLPFMEKLLAYLEAHGDSSVVVDFHSPSPEAMGLVDNVVRSGATGGGSVALVAPSFDGEHSLPRESKILQGLQAGFAAMVPTGAMVLRPGRRIADLTMTPAEALPKKRAATPIPDAKQPDPPPELISPLGAVHVPTLEVHYRVGWSGDVSIWKKGEPRIAGVVIRFDVTMRLPDQPDTFGFSLEVPPPDHFPAYDVTADRAFDQLADKLRAVFVLPHDDGRAGQREPPPGGTRQ